MEKLQGWVERGGNQVNIVGPVGPQGPQGPPGVGGDDSSLVTFIQTGPGAIERNVQDRLRDTVHAADFFGTDAGMQIQNAINSLPVTGGTVDARALPAGSLAAATILLDKAVTLVLPQSLTLQGSPGIRLSMHGAAVIGAGQRASILYFNPSVAGAIAIYAQYTAASAIAQCRLEGFGLDSSGNTVGTKIAIRVTDGEEIIIKDIAISNWNSPAEDCIGFQLQGRQALFITNVVVFTNRPVVMEDDPNTVFDCDHHHFSNCYLACVLASGAPSNTHPVIEIASGVNVSDLTFDGYQAWIAGSHGLYWNDTTSFIAPYGITIENARWEQSTNANGYIIYFNPFSQASGVTIRNCYGGAFYNHKGYFLRNIRGGVFSSNTYSGQGEALKIDGTVQALSFIGNLLLTYPTATQVTTGWSEGVFIGNELTKRIGIGVANPIADLVLHFDADIASLDSAGVVEHPLIRLGTGGVVPQVQIARDGLQTFVGGPIFIGSIFHPHSSIIGIPNGQAYGGGNAAGTDTIGMIGVDPLDQVNIGNPSFPTRFFGKEVDSPPLGSLANSGTLYFKDNGAGKTQLVVMFSDGLEIVLATMA